MEGKGESSDSEISLASLLNIQIKGQPPDQIKRVVVFHWKYSQDPYWKNEIKSASNFISRFGSMLKQVPVGWKEPLPRTRKVANPNCEKCAGAGGRYFDNSDGAKMWEDCPCLKRVAA